MRLLLECDSIATIDGKGEEPERHMELPDKQVNAGNHMPMEEGARNLDQWGILHVYLSHQKT